MSCDLTLILIIQLCSLFQLIGMSVLFGITFIGAILLSTWPICADSCCLACCKRDIEVHELILEAGEDIVSKTMKEEQQSKLSANVKKYIDQGKWVNCLDVVEEFIDTIGRDEVSQTVSLLFYRMTCEVKILNIYFVLYHSSAVVGQRCLASAGILK